MDEAQAGDERPDLPEPTEPPELTGIVELVAPGAFAGWAFLESREVPQLAVYSRGQQVHAWGRMQPRPDVAEHHGWHRRPVGFFCLLEPDDPAVGTDPELEFFIGGQQVHPLVATGEQVAAPWVHELLPATWPAGSLIDGLASLAAGEPIDRLPGSLRSDLIEVATAVGREASLDPAWFATGPVAGLRDRMTARAAALQVVREYREGTPGPAARALEAHAWTMLGVVDRDYLAAQRWPADGSAADDHMGHDESPNPLMPVAHWRDVVRGMSLDPGFVHPVLMALWSPGTWASPLHPAFAGDGDDVPDVDDVPESADVPEHSPVLAWFEAVSTARWQGRRGDGSADLTQLGLAIWERDVGKRAMQHRLLAPRRREAALERGLAPVPESIGRAGVAAVAGYLAEQQAAEECVHGRVPGDVPAVSVVMPSVRRGESLADALASVLAQTCASWELIVVDDSPEGSLDLSSATDLDPSRVTVLRTGGRGAAAARNAGAAAARGRWLMWLDDDDVLMPDAVEVVLRAVADSDTAWAYGKTILWDGQRCQVIGEPHDDARLRFDNYVTQLALAVDRETFLALGGYDETLPRTIDYDLILRLANSHAPTFVDAVLAVADVRKSRRRISTTASPRWANHVVNRSDARWAGPSPDGAAGLSVVIPVYTDWARAADVVRRLRIDLAAEDLEIIVVDDGLAPPDFAALGVECDLSEASLVSTWVNQGFAAACNEGFLTAGRSRVVFLNDDVRVGGGALRRLADVLDDPAVGGAQAVTLMDEGRRYETVGVVIPEAGLPYAFLHGMRVDPLLADDIRGLRFQAINGAVLAVRAGDFRAVRGFDPMFRNGMEDVDLCLRISQAAIDRGDRAPVFTAESDATCLHDGLGSGSARTAGIPENRQLFAERWSGRLRADDVAMWDRLYFRVDGYDVPAGQSILEIMPAPRVQSRTQKSSSAGGPFRLDVLVATPATRLGIEPWGDTYFGMAVVRSLRKMGFASDVFSFDSEERDDDVMQLHLLGLFGAGEVVTEGNAAWVISHPSRQSADLLSGYAGLIVASNFWSPPCGEPLGRILQPTDIDSFGTRPGDGPDVTGRCLFVGNRRNADRAVVRWAVESGLPVTIVGTGWDDLAEYPNVVVSAPVPRRQVFALYRDARLVLNDHWPDMLVNGFVSNRLADLQAVGACVATDVPLRAMIDVSDNQFAVHRREDVARAWEWSAERPDPMVAPTPWTFDAAVARVVDLLRGAGLLA